MGTHAETRLLDLRHTRLIEGFQCPLCRLYRQFKTARRTHSNGLGP